MWLHGSRVTGNSISGNKEYGRPVHQNSEVKLDRRDSCGGDLLTRNDAENNGDTVRLWHKCCVRNISAIVLERTMALADNCDNTNVCNTDRSGRNTDSSVYCDS